MKEIARMMRSLRDAKVSAPQREPVTLTEAEYFRMAKLSQDVVLARHAAEAALAVVREKEAARNAYFTDLQGRYPAFDPFAGNYSGNDETFTLTPLGESAQ